MATVTTQEVANVTMQQMVDAGLNAFAVDLLVESFAKHDNPPPLRFVWRGVEISLKAYDAERTEPHALTLLAEAVHLANAKWWVSMEDGVTPLKRNKGELLMLIVSEVAEAMEGERKDLMDDKLPHRKMAEVELADTLIRILDYSAGFGYDIAGAFVEKMDFNRVREDHTHEARRIAGGKQF